MSRHTFLNIALALIAVVSVGSVVYLENKEGASSETTTTAETTTTTIAPTTTTTLPPETTEPPTTPAETAPAPTEPPTTLAPTTLPPPERGLVPVVVTSAGSTGERVGPTVYLLSLAGWTDIRGVNGAVPAAFTIVYYLDGFQSAAEQMALDMSIPITSVAPIAAAPPISGLGNAALVVYLGG